MKSASTLGLSNVAVLDTTSISVVQSTVYIQYLLIDTALKRSRLCLFERFLSVKGFFFFLSRDS